MDPYKDWLLRSIFTLAQGLSAHASKGTRTEIPRPNNEIGDDEMLTEILKEMIRAGKLDEAENLLFRFVENYPLMENYAIGLDFYEEIAAFTDEELAECGWSRDEIKDGLMDLYRLAEKE
ncbi:MAG: hypothetical protein IIY02_00300 [Firmicutes bacterium]|nr:hypothetical protein [Bacillota bacterium]